MSVDICLGTLCPLHNDYLTSSAREQTLSILIIMLKSTHSLLWLRWFTKISLSAL